MGFKRTLTEAKEPNKLFLTKIMIYWIFLIEKDLEASSDQGMLKRVDFGLWLIVFLLMGRCFKRTIVTTLREKGSKKLFWPRIWFFGSLFSWPHLTEKGIFLLEETSPERKNQKTSSWSRKWFIGSLWILKSFSTSKNYDFFQFPVLVLTHIFFLQCLFMFDSANDW